MSMNAIFASKLYKASKHKDKIKAALANPINTELVMQLTEYLDDDEVNQLADQVDTSKSDESNESSDANDKLDEDTKSEATSEKIRPSQHTERHTTPPADHHLSEAVAKSESDENSVEPTEKKTFDVQPQTSESEDVAESTTTTGSSVTANCIIYPQSSTISVDAIIGALNAREDTAGVCRAVLRDAELWIHYNDSVNLNNVMEPAIALLNAAGYTMLNFNRLARTENAIVFTISQNNNLVQPLKETVSE